MSLTSFRMPGLPLSEEKHPGILSPSLFADGASLLCLATESEGETLGFTWKVEALPLLERRKRKFYRREAMKLTNPCLSEMLLVSFSLWKVSTLDIHCSPVAGLSGWMYILFGISGSAFPATIHRELWNLYRQSSAAIMSINKMYLAFLSSPEHLTLNGGNIRLRGERRERKKISLSFPGLIFYLKYLNQI